MTHAKQTTGERVPQRIQLSRMKGYNLQLTSRALNGLDAVNCARPSKWGNPFLVSGVMTAELCVWQFKTTLRYCQQGAIFAPQEHWLHMNRIAQDIDELEGKNLACFCHPSKPCHCDVLLEFANATLSEPPKHSQEQA